MTKTEMVKKKEITDEEIQRITGLYKQFSPQNRTLMLMASNLLLASQQSNESDQKAG